jgi:hypothetical protein
MKSLFRIVLTILLAASFSQAQEFAFSSASQSFESEGKIEVVESDSETVLRLSQPDAVNFDREARSVGCSTTGCTIRCTTSCTTRCTTNCSRLSPEKQESEVTK